MGVLYEIVTSYMESESQMLHKGEEKQVDDKALSVETNDKTEEIIVSDVTAKTS